MSIPNTRLPDIPRVNPHVSRGTKPLLSTRSDLTFVDVTSWTSPLSHTHTLVQPTPGLYPILAAVFRTAARSCMHLGICGAKASWSRFSTFKVLWDQPLGCNLDFRRVEMTKSTQHRLLLPNSDARLPVTPIFFPPSYFGAAAQTGFGAMSWLTGWACLCIFRHACQRIKPVLAQGAKSQTAHHSSPLASLAFLCSHT